MIHAYFKMSKEGQHINIDINGYFELICKLIRSTNGFNSNKFQHA